MKINDIINEAILQMDDDVDRIYDKFIKPSIVLITEFNEDSFRMAEYIRKNQPKEGYSLQKLIDDGIIQNKKVIAANEIEPTTIYFFSGNGNVYRPATLGRHSQIHIDYNIDAFNIIKNWHKGHSSIEDMAYKILPKHQAVNFVNEFTPAKSKASINHEFAHFVDDILHNRHISKKLHADPYFKKYSLIGDQFDTYMEIEGQIHNIHQLKRENIDKWDNMSFSDMVDMLPSFQTLGKMTGVARERWLKMIKTRMAREGLLGKSMR